MVVVVQNASFEGTELTNQSDMEQACLAENRSQFSQSTHAKTPFTIQPLLEDFGYLAVRSEAKKVLSGTYEAPPGTGPHAKTFIKLLQWRIQFRR